MTDLLPTLVNSNKAPSIRGLAGHNLDCEDDPANSYLRGLKSKQSQKTQLSVVKGILMRLGVADIRQANWQQLLRKMTIENMIDDLAGEGKSDSYKNSYLAAFRGLTQAAYEQHYIDDRQRESVFKVRYESIEPDISDTEERPLMTPADVRHLLDHCAATDTLKGIRDAAIFALAFGTGMRVSELASLKVDSFSRDFSRVRYVGKRKKRFDKELSKSTQEHVNRWGNARLDAGGSGNDWMFLPVNKSDALKLVDRRTPDGQAKGIGTRSIQRLFEHRALEAGKEHISPHSFRRGVLTWLFDQNVDSAFIAGFSGHSSVDVLRKRYDLRQQKRIDKVSRGIKF